MKLYYHPASTTSRPIALFVAENDILIDMQMIDIFHGEHRQPAYAAINPNALVPVLEDGDFRLTESSAILKYLADKFDSTLYPKDLRQRARVNERMDWFNTQLSRDFCFGLVFAQLLPHHKRRSDEAQSATVQWARSTRRSGCRCSTTISSVLGATTCAVMRSRSPTISVRRFSRWARWSVATLPPIPMCSAGSDG